jgi:transcriptional regulator with XRE-family HTH domain
VGRRVGLERKQFARCFGVNLAKARNAADVSQDELAFRTSTHRTAISQIERGLSLSGLDSAMKFAAALERRWMTCSWESNGNRQRCK